MTKKKMTAREAAEYLGVSDDNMRKMLQYGKIKAEKVEGLRRMEWRVTKKALNEFRKEGHTRAFCYGCDNRANAVRCHAYKNINDPIVGEDGHCISKEG